MKRIPLNNQNNAKSLVLAGLLSIAATAGVAQSQDTVTIKFDDGDGITGELMEFSGDIIRLNSSIGSITIPTDGISCIGAACPQSLRLEITSSPLTLTSLDGSTRLSGDLIEVTQGQYVIATDAGELRVDINKVTCEGEGCIVQVSAPVFGGEVTLTSGATAIEGLLLGVEGNAYIIDVANMGTMRVSTEQFQCSGVSCP